MANLRVRKVTKGLLNDPPPEVRYMRVLRKSRNAPGQTSEQGESTGLIPFQISFFLDS